MAQILSSNFKSKCFRLCNFLKTNISVSAARNYSTNLNMSPKVKKSVFISQSSDVFSNLALEDWLYRNFDFTKHHVLLMWRNSPCVIIGRHQNPWLETNHLNAAKYEIDIARRSSGGGTVYHDTGNLNLTFFTPRDGYNRKKNLQIISQVLSRDYAISTDINSREDIVVQNDSKQISGTAAKLGHPNAYHHCTLLVNNNKFIQSEVLHVDYGIFTKATQSIHSPSVNLSELNSQVTVEQLSAAIGWEYLRTCPITFEDHGMDHVSQQNGFHLVNPTDRWFPGLKEIRDELTSWEWRFGHTPKFTISRSFVVPEDITEPSLPDQVLQITVTVDNGIIQNITMMIPSILVLTQQFFDTSVMAKLRGQQFTEETVNMLDKILENWNTPPHGTEFVVNCMKQVMLSA